MLKKIKQKLFGNDVEIKCEYCRNSSDFDGSAACSLGRELEPDGNCRKFEYDPLKREPVSLPPLKQHDPDEFKL